MRESELASKTLRELFGPEGFLLEGKGVKRVLRVAMDIDYVRQKAGEKGLNVGHLWTDEDVGTCYAVYRDGRPMREALPITEDSSAGHIWVSDVELEKFCDLIGIDKRAIA